MKKYTARVLSTITLIAVSVLARAQFQYLSPEPGTIYHDPSTTIILRNGNTIDQASLRAGIFKITGSLTGRHNCELKLLENYLTISLKPIEPFAPGETVTVNVSDGIRTMSGDAIHGTSYNFTIREAKTDEQIQRISAQMKEFYSQEADRGPTRLKNVSPGFPPFTIDTNLNATPGQVFWSNFNFFTGQNDHYCIIENNGDSVFGKYDTTIYNDFDLNKNGYPTVFNDEDSAFLMLDSNYQSIAEYQMGNGYKADPHEFIINPDGTHYMISYDPEIVDMTVYNATYQPNATVVGCIFQELDSNNNVIFQWRSWDHYSILDGDHISFSNAFIDYCHANSIEPDNDGNLIFSCRNMSEVTKVNRATAAIIWRWGGLNNQFTFIGDPDQFSYQHDARRISNGHITLFDNGNYHTVLRSYAKEYIIDEVNKTATLTWSYTRALSGGNVFGKAMGNVQRLSNGNTLICWGLVQNQPGAPKITELDPLNNIVWEMTLDGEQATYRAHRHSWEPCARPSASGIYSDMVFANTAKVHWGTATNAVSYDVQYRKLGNQTWKLKTATGKTKKLKNLTASTTYEYEIRSHCDSIPTMLSNFTAIKTFTTLPMKQMLTAEVHAPQINLYPNPAETELQLQLQLTTAQRVNIVFYDITGKECFRSSQNAESGDQILHYNIVSLVPGMYVAEIETATGKSMQKFIKQ